MRKFITFIISIFLITTICSFSAMASDTVIYNFDDTIKEELYKTLNNAVLNGETEVDISKFNIHVSDAQFFASDYIWDNPEFSFPIISSAYTSTNDKLKTIIFTYDDANTIKSRHTAIMNEVNNIVTLINPDWNDIQKLMWINDYICDSFSYNLQTEYHTLDKFLSKKEGICEAYTNLVTAICKQINIDVSYCFSNEIQHIWNVVKVDNTWYHLDTTWNDTFSQRYESFLISDAETSKIINDAYDNIHHTLVSPKKMTSDKYKNAFWRNEIYGSMCPDTNGDVYYIDDFKLYKGNVNSLTTKEICKIKDKKWPADGGYYTLGFNDCVKIGEYIYYNTPNTIEKLSLTTKQSKKVYEYNTDDIVSIQLTSSGWQIGHNANPMVENVSFNNIYIPDIHKVVYTADSIVVYVTYYLTGTQLKNPTNIQLSDSRFLSWDKPDGTIINGITFISAQTEAIKDFYTITFKVGDEIYKEYLLEYGEQIPLPQAPTKAPNGNVNFSFDFWEGYNEHLIADRNYIFTAVFKDNVKQFTIIFYDGEQKISTLQLNAGEAITYPEVPTFVGKDGTTYKFVGWTSNSTIATKDEVIYTIYADTTTECLIQYICDGQVFYEQVVPSGSVLELITQYPTKTDSKTYKYQFIEWSGAKNGDVIMSDIRIIAIFEAIPKENNLPNIIAISMIIVIAIPIIIYFVGNRKKKNNNNNQDNYI